MPPFPKPRPIASRLDQFAELLARGMEPPLAAEALGIKPSSGKMYLLRLRKDLGWQAQ